MDAVVLANYATEHAPYAIKALKMGKHVYSEVLPTQTLKEAVELIEAVEESGKIYAYGENYCYMSGPMEMKKLYNGNKDADVIDVYEALDMSLVGLFAYRSILNGSTPIEIPNLRIKEERDKWRNDTACTSKELAGEQLLPTRKVVLLYLDKQFMTNKRKFTNKEYKNQIATPMLF